MVDEMIELREAMVDEVEDLLNQFEESIDNEAPHIKGNLIKACNQMRNEGEYLYNIRLALQQMQGYSGSVRNEAQYNSVMTRVDELNESIEAAGRESPR